MRYDKAWSALASRAVKQGAMNADTFLEMASASGMSGAEIERRLLDDLDNDGPIFGSFMRSLKGAAATTVLAAERQGAVAAAMDGDAELERLLGVASLDDVIDDADPEALDEIAAAAATQEFVWIATLVNTCERCLPLHGHRRTLEEWDAMGLNPETIHEGWASPCYCTLEGVDALAGEDVKEPLSRTKLKTETGLKGSRRTARGVAQQDLDRARSAVTKASDSLEGRRTLRILGQANAEDSGDE